MGTSYGQELVRYFCVRSQALRKRDVLHLCLA